MRMYRAVAVSLVVADVIFATVIAQSRAEPVRASVSQLAWLAGSWAGKAGITSFEERWTPPAGGVMLAVGRTLKGERLASFEFLRIVERNGGLIYVAQPEGRPPTEFVLTAMAPDTATFENPKHDFPKMIRYSRLPDGRLEARVSDGGPGGETFLFSRTP
jgi:hypothetical protein